MREYRAIRTDNGEWVYGCLVKDQTKEKYIIYGKSQYHFVKPETIGQYIGLKDKNLNKIFEGDIVRHHNFGIGQVEWDSYECKYKVQWRNNLIKPNILHLKLGEIIGNIYKN